MVDDGQLVQREERVDDVDVAQGVADVAACVAGCDHLWEFVNLLMVMVMVSGMWYVVWYVEEEGEGRRVGWIDIWLRTGVFQVEELLGDAAGVAACD